MFRREWEMNAGEMGKERKIRRTNERDGKRIWEKGGKR
jgi:hypothetical protein